MQILGRAKGAEQYKLVDSVGSDAFEARMRVSPQVGHHSCSSTFCQRKERVSGMCLLLLSSSFKSERRS